VFLPASAVLNVAHRLAPLAPRLNIHGICTLTGDETLKLDPDGGVCAGKGLKMLNGFATLKLGTAVVTATVTVPLWVVPAGVVTEKGYEPTGTLEPTVRLIGRLCDVPPRRMVAESPPCENVTAVALPRLNPSMTRRVVAPWGTLVGSTPAIIGGTNTLNALGLVAVPLAFVTAMNCHK